ncbi:esterase-like activity of phytase family protein [Chryseosolibacter indicus]|uniref:Esterase-like activity of phytase family protein n=1 Tax=Chryseosolibacter indicus TaxID=2782351 RepID=A0ABS5VQL5_9BACT|nr:esterase-like activity of phytase family protein [Chryseosolibacter indicus]MBT1703727.1 esterase-like activity of phytase family protein [Chryseosolibacter indicus]
MISFSIKHSLFIFLLFWVGKGNAQQASTQVKSSSKLKFLHEYEVPYNFKFKSTTVGGLSGVDYDSKKDIYYLISDDRSSINASRFYKAKVIIKNNKIDTVLFTDVHTIMRPDNTPYPDAKKNPVGATDPESMRYDGKRDRLVWTSEGERIVKKAEVLKANPAITIMSTEGKYIDVFPLPENLNMKAIEKGPRQNGVLEGVTFDKDFNTMYMTLEEPLYEDGPRADVVETNSYVRIYQFDAETKKNTKQFAYKLDPVAYPALTTTAFKVNGVSEILYAGENKLFVMERSFSTGRLSCTVKVFLADLSEADDVTEIPSLKEQPPSNVVKKTLLLNMDSLGRYIDNVECISYGPVLPNGHQSLLFVSDNNFNSFEKTQFFLFEIVP